jgi:hypothetical protein
MTLRCAQPCCYESIYKSPTSSSQYPINPPSIRIAMLSKSCPWAYFFHYIAVAITTARNSLTVGIKSTYVNRYGVTEHAWLQTFEPMGRAYPSLGGKVRVRLKQTHHYPSYATNLFALACCISAFRSKHQVSCCNLSAARKVLFLHKHPGIDVNIVTVGPGFRPCASTSLE